MATTPQIINVIPAPDSLGIPVGNPIHIEFDQEMDLTTLNSGTIVLTGPDEAPVFGPVDITPFDSPGFQDEDILSSPYFKGYVKGTFSFLKYDNSGGILDDVVDETGEGNLWRTVVEFTPNTPLKPNVKYTVIILGDEAPTDNFNTGAKTRTVFDTVFNGSGDGIITFQGGYTGSSQISYEIEITDGGTTGVAEYIWWKSNDPLTTYSGRTTTGERELDNGVFITCSNDGSFTVGDRFSVIVVPAITLPNNYRWTFTTGDGSILTPPSTQPTSGIESILTNIAGSSSISTLGVGVSKIIPEDGKYGVPISTDPYIGEQIIITFNTPMNPDSLAYEAIQIRSEAANGNTERFRATGDIDFIADLNSNVLTITLDPGQLYENNIVILELSETVADTEGNTLGTKFISYFTTPYASLYSSYRRIQMDIGPLIVGVPEETIMLAILEASIQADALTFGFIKNIEFFKQARWEYTTCLAESILLKALLGDTGGSRMSKTLGELSISRDGGDYLMDALNRAEDCVLKWLLPLETGGELAPYSSVKPQVSVKGALASDAITVGRQWEPTSDSGYNSRGAANTKRRASGRRDLRTFRSRNSRSWGRDYD